MSALSYGCHHSGQFANFCRAHGGVGMSLDLQRAEHRLEHFVAAAAHHFAMSSCLLTYIHVAQTVV